jgi:hypothetical protein
MLVNISNQHTLRGVPELRFSATLGEEPEVELALV